VHQLRVAARTLRSAISTFRKAVADKDVERIKGELRWLARACDQARNLDVFAEGTVTPALKLDSPPRGLPELADAIDAGRDHARTEVVQAVGSARFRDFLIELAAWLQTGEWLSDERAERRAKPFAADALDARRRKLLKAGRRLDEATDAERHKVRIGAKKLRYAAEGFQSLFGRKAAGRFIDRLKDLQDELGALNDLATAEALLAELDLAPEAALAAGELVGRKSATKSRLIARAAEAVEKLADVEPFWR
jgi:CHAD domain-containing protein